MDDIGLDELERSLLFHRITDELDRLLLLYGGKPDEWRFHYDMNATFHSFYVNGSYNRVHISNSLVARDRLKATIEQYKEMWINPGSTRSAKGNY